MAAARSICQVYCLSHKYVWSHWRLDTSGCSAVTEALSQLAARSVPFEKNLVLNSMASTAFYTIAVQCGGAVIAPSFKVLCIVYVLLPNFLLGQAYFYYKYGAAAYCLHGCDLRAYLYQLCLMLSVSAVSYELFAIYFGIIWFVSASRWCPALLRAELFLEDEAVYEVAVPFPFFSSPAPPAFPHHPILVAGRPSPQHRIRRSDGDTRRDVSRMGFERTRPQLSLEFPRVVIPAQKADLTRIPLLTDSGAGGETASVCTWVWRDAVPPFPNGRSCYSLPSRYLRLTTYYLRLTTLTTYDSLLTTYYSLLTTHYSLLTTHYSPLYSFSRCCWSLPPYY